MDETAIPTIQQAAAAAARGDANNQILSAGLMALGAGGALRGAQYLARELVGRKRLARREVADSEYPVPVQPGSLARFGRSVIVPEPLGKAAVDLKGLGDFMAGSRAESASGVPYYPMAMALAAGGGLYAGYKGIDAIVGAADKAKAEKDIDLKRKAFHDAIIGLYAKPQPAGSVVKTAAEQTPGERIGRALDKAFDALSEKMAENGAHTAGQALGMYGLYAGGSSLLMGYLAYQAAKKRTDQAVMEEAVNRRNRSLSAQRPTPLQVTLQPVSSLPAEAKSDQRDRLVSSV